ncbi:hypothetical protein [Rhodopirellula sp. SWK7]|uniref:hypothetical protein n=1 Tax=Rhodopirellula sp. SWK7 TaxID=595460 RepID=UPI0005C55030|nr:hypothetical protein [Rhodopirellula sp. SWK7]
MNELVAMFRQLHDEKIAWNAYRTLDYAQAELIEQVPMVLEDRDCDNADDVSKYAIAANEALARTIIKQHPQSLKEDVQELLNRRSSRFRTVIAEWLSENPQENFAAFFRTAINANDDDLISASLQGLRSAIAKQRLQGSSRDEVFSLLLRLCDSANASLQDVPSIVAFLDAERAKTELVTDEILRHDNPALASILRNACELDSHVSGDSLMQIFEQVDNACSGNVRDPNLILSWIVRLAMGKQDSAFAPVLERASQHRNIDVKRLGLLGLVKLRLPHDPIRTSVEAVNSAPLKSLSTSVKVVAFASKYIDEVEEQDDGLLVFLRRTSGKHFRYTIKSLGLLKATPHVSVLTWMLDELGENPKASLKEMRRPELEALERSLATREKRLSFDRLRILLYQYVLANLSCFRPK